MTDVVTRDGFEAWLAGKADETVVGVSCRAESCPLATYLREQGHGEVRVRDEYYVLDGTNEFRLREEDQAPHYPLDKWAQRLVRAVDYDLLELVTAGEVRAILAQLDA